MVDYENFLLGLTQGVCEFLPISSSAHLTIFFKDIPYHTVISLHLATILTVVAFYRKDIARLVLGGFDMLLRRSTKNRLEALLVLTTFIPFAVVGFIVDHFYKITSSNISIGVSGIIFGILFYLSNLQISYRRKDVHSFTDAIIIGCFQLFSIIPGASRLGCTVTGMRILGYNMHTSIKFSLIISIPVIISANIWYFIKAAFHINNFVIEKGFDLHSFIITFVSAFGFGCVSLYIFNKYADKKVSIIMITLYRIIFGISLILL